MTPKSKKILILIAVLAALSGAAWYFFVYKQSPTQIAAGLNLYTGDTQHDTTLNNMINQALAGGGTISGTNLEWELNETANYIAQNEPPEDQWRVNGKITAPGAFLARIDSYHDYLSGNPDLTHTELTVITVGAETEEEVANVNTYGGNAYIPQESLNNLWTIFNSYKNILEGKIIFV